MSCHARRRRHVFASSQLRSTDEQCMTSSAHAARLLSPHDALDVRLLLPQFTRTHRLHVFVDAQRCSTDEPCMPSSAHAAHLLSLEDAHDVRLPPPQTPYRRRVRVFVNAQQRSTDELCMPSSAHAARLQSPQDAIDVRCLRLSRPANIASIFLLTANNLARMSHACRQAPTQHAYISHRTPSTSACICLTRPIDVADVF